jgi:small subunit ribosomal protein S20
VANTVSADKRHRQSLKRKARNTSVKTSVKTAVKKAREAIAKGDMGKAKEAVRQATVLLDKAATKGVLHARNASRRVGRLSAEFSKKAAAPAK